MDVPIAQQILTEVRELGARLDVKIDGLDAKIDAVRNEWKIYFDELNASTQYCYGELSAKVDALRADIVRNTRKRH